MENKDDLQLFIGKLTRQASMPDPAFKDGLREKMIPKFNFWKSFGFRAFYMVSTLGVSFVFIFLILNTLGYLNLPSQNLYITGEDEQMALLANVYKSNPSNMITALQTEDEGSESKISDQTQENINYKNIINISQETQVEKNFNYFKTTSENRLGAKADLCPSLKAEAQIPNTETYIFEQKGNFTGTYLKVINRDSNQVLLSYSLITPSEDYIYYGGKYALKIINKDNTAEDEKIIEQEKSKLTESLVISQGPTAEENERIKTLFGQDTKITKNTVEGKNVYQIEYRINNYQCSGSINQSTRPNLVFILTVDPENNYQVIEKSVYQDNANENNLIINSTYSNVQNNLTYDEAKQEFSFNVPVEIKTIDSRLFMEADNAKTTVQNIISSNNIALVFDNSNGYAIQELQYDANTYMAKYYLDRDFYSPENILKQIYEQNYAFYTANPLFSYTYTSSGTTIPAAVSIYSQMLKKEDIIKRLNIQLSKSKQVTVLINNAKINAEIYESTVNTGTPAYTIYFEYNNHKYVLSTSGQIPSVFSLKALPFGSNESELVIQDYFSRQ